MTSQDSHTTKAKAAPEKGVLFAMSQTNNYAAHGVDRFIRNNVYNLGVRRNLLQVFGDAKLHHVPADSQAASRGDVLQSDDDAAARTRGNRDTTHTPRHTRPRYPYFRDYMRSDTFAHPNWLVRWFWRLLPYPAYGAPMPWRPLGDYGALMVSARTLHEQWPRAHRGGGYVSYGAVETCRSDEANRDGGGGGSPSLQESGQDSILEYLDMDERQLLGLRFPTRASLALT